MRHRRNRTPKSATGPLPAPTAGDAVDIWLWLHHAAAPLVYRSAWLDPTTAADRMISLTNSPGGTQ